MTADKLVLPGEAEEEFVGLVYELASLGVRSFGGGGRLPQPGLWDVAKPWSVHFKIPDRGVLTVLTDLIRLVDQIGDDYKEAGLTPPLLVVRLYRHTRSLAGTLVGSVLTPTNVAMLLHDLRKLFICKGLMPENLEASSPWPGAFSRYLDQYSDE